MAMEQPERYLVFFDVETTGLHPERDRVIEIYLLKVYKNGHVSEYHTLINPERAIPRKITEITGITDSDVKSAPVESNVVANIKEFIGEGVIVAHNLSFDRGFLNAMFRRNDLGTVGNYGIDTLAWSRELFPKLCIYPDGGGSHRLKNLMYHFSLEKEFQNAHRAKDDVRLLVQVYRNLQRISFQDEQDTYPQALTHGCPNCGQAMRLSIVEGRRELVCTSNSACRQRLVV